MKYQHIVLGGSFDHLHRGHRSLLKTAFAHGDRVTIGLVTDKALEQKVHRNQMQSYSTRQRALRAEINRWRGTAPCFIMPINDIYGPSIIDESMDAIIATASTLHNVQKVNSERRKRGLSVLKIVMVPEVPAEDGGSLSSTRIRNGEIDREGYLYFSRFRQSLRLPDNDRARLRKPFGKIFSGSESKRAIAAKKTSEFITDRLIPITIGIGDVVTASLTAVGSSPTISIVDFKNKRRSIGVLPRVDGINPPGTISAEAVAALYRAIQGREEGKMTIMIDGEEDLLVLPAILLAPLNTLVLYGQMDIGIVAVEVTERKKIQVQRILERFEIILKP